MVKYNRGKYGRVGKFYHTKLIWSTDQNYPLIIREEVWILKMVRGGVGLWSQVPGNWKKLIHGKI